MTPRFYTDTGLLPGISVSLPAAAARHVQVLRLQPGDSIRLFNGKGDDAAQSEGESEATIQSMGRSEVVVRIGAFTATRRESPRALHLAVGMPANDRMDWLLEKAAELGAASIQPLMTERSVLRLSGERSEKKLAHWRGIVIAACEQCGRNRLPVVHASALLGDWLKTLEKSPGDFPATRLLLSLRGAPRPVTDALLPGTPALFLSGPEGGLTQSEEDAAMTAGFTSASLGPRVLRAETASLACLALAALG